MSGRLSAALAYLGRRQAERGLAPTARDIYGAVAMFSDTAQEARDLESWLFDQFPEARPLTPSKRATKVEA